MDRLARFSLGRRALTALVTFAIAALGVFSMANLRQELIPSISFPAAAILGVYPGASPQVVEDQVTDVVELAVGGVGGVEEVSSTAASNISATTVLFEFGTDMDAAVQALRTAMDQVSGQLPEDVTPQIITGSIDQLPVVQLAAAGGIDDDALADAVETTLVPRLERIDGVRGVSVAGAAEREILLDVNLPALIGAGLTPDSVLSVLDDNGVRLPAGTLTEGEQTLSVQVGTPLTSVEEFADLPLATEAGTTVRLGDVVEVVDGEAAASSFSRLNGEPSLAISITQTPSANVVDTSDRVADVLADIEETLAAQEVEVAVVFDQAPFITESIEGLAVEGMLGLAFAVVVILLFLMSVTSTLVSAVSIPLSLLAAFAVMYATGYTLNILTLAALTISIGRVVDDSIVVIENIKRHLSYGEERTAAIITAVKEVAGAVTSSTLATVAVFVPIGLVGGFVGELFRPFAFTVAIAMLASLFVSLTIVPVLARWFLRPPRSTRDPEAAATAREEAERRERHGIWQRTYVPTLAWALRRPVITLVAAFAVLGGSLALVPRLETNLLGDMGQDTVNVTQSFAPGTSLAAQDAAAREVEDALMALDGVETVQSTVGSGTGMAAFGAIGGASASFALTLAEDADGAAVTEEVRDAVSGLATGPVTDIEVSAGDAMVGASTVDLLVTADDIGVLAEAATLVRDAAAGVDGAAQVSSNLAADQPVVEVTVDRAAAAEVGLSETAVAGSVAGMMNDPQVGTVDLGSGPVTVRASFGDGPASVDELRAVPLTTAAGPVLLAQVASVEVVETPTTITRIDGNRSATIAVTPAGQDLGALTGELRTAVDELELPPGAEVEIGGVAADQAEAFANLGLALALAIVIVYIVLVATFNSLVQPLILLVSVPFAVTGSLVALLVTGTALGVPALIGFLMLVGIVVSNAIVLIDLINQYRSRGRSLAEAVTEGARKRLRPIVMTAAATIFALLPMAFGITGGGSFISQPLALVVIGGLISSTLLTLVVVPVLYTLFERRTERGRRRAEA